VRNKLDPQLAADGISPSILVRSYSDKEWEVFIEEWTSGFEPKYHFVERIGGTGDKGRDVIAYLGPQNDATTEWDNYQCKRYNAPIDPSDMWTDFGKLCYYTWRGDYSVPRRYRIVAPLEIKPGFKELLKHPIRIKEQLKSNWAQHCTKKITLKHDIPLEGKLADYVEAFDFSIIGYLTVVQILEQHAKTPFWDVRFKEKAPKRPADATPPPEPAASEAGYVRQLLDAYADHEKLPSLTLEELHKLQRHTSHYHRCREDFYKAESLYRFTKDSVKLGSFEDFKQHVLDTVIDVHEDDHTSALERLKKTTQEALKLPPMAGQLSAIATPGDKKGACHHLANEVSPRLLWKQ
jgi:hypothetical protein